jgi:hypothetical protein
VYFKEGARVLTVTAWRGVFRFSGMGAWCVWMSRSQLSGAPRNHTGRSTMFKRCSDRAHEDFGREYLLGFLILGSVATEMVQCIPISS